MRVLIFQQLVFIFIYVACQNDPKIITITPTQLKIPRDPVTFSCTVQNFGHDVLWKRKVSSNTELISTNTALNIANNRFKIDFKDFKNDTSMYSLTITDFDQSDIGTYICEIPVDKSPTITQETTLEAVVWPSFYDNSTEFEKVDEGKDFTIKCYASGKPQPTIVIIRSDGGSLPNNLSVYPGNELKIENITKEDEGNYTCEARNVQGGVRTRDIYILVHAKPLIQSCTMNVVYEPLSAEFECVINSVSKLVVSWHKDGQDLGNDQTFDEPNKKLYHAKLKIVNAQVQYGYYTVIARNNQGERKTTVAFLSEITPPPTPPCSCSSCFLITLCFSVVVGLIVIAAIAYHYEYMTRHEYQKTAEDPEHVTMGDMSDEHSETRIKKNSAVKRCPFLSKVSTLLRVWPRAPT